MHKSQFLYQAILSIVNADGGSGSVDGKGGTDETSSGFALEVFCVPNAINGADGKVAINDRAAIDGVKGNEVVSIL